MTKLGITIPIIAAAMMAKSEGRFWRSAAAVPSKRPRKKAIVIAGQPVGDGGGCALSDEVVHIKVADFDGGA